jgi:hypothetical protein
MFKDQPISEVKWIDVSKIQANDYNPNTVGKIELKLLYTSIVHDGFTQPLVTIYDKKIDKYIIVDGFHRYSVFLGNKDLAERTDNKLPVVVLKKSITERMASTIRHNRARGKHSVVGMSNLVFSMLDKGSSDELICRELGMEPDELLRLKHITGFSKLFEDAEYHKSWKSKTQLQLEKEHKTVA